jgi:L-2-hydroxyglutarate oxidase LhgO
MDNVDVIIIGAGVVGLAITAKISATFKNVLIIDKNHSFGEETSSRNSEVIHAGIYYPENSFKAKFCVEGKNKLYQYCQERHIPHQRLGKLIVAHGVSEEAYLAKALKQAQLNHVDDLSWVDCEKLKKTIPELSATAALISPSTGIIDVHSYMQTLLAEAQHNNAQFVGQTSFIKAEPSNKGFNVTLESQGEEITIHCRYLINSAGLHATKVAKNIISLSPMHIPELYYCRGHYFSYQGKSPFKQLIYPVPTDHGLGIHASLDVGGQLKFGPDTQYINELNYQVSEALKQKFVQAIQRYFPKLDPDRIQPAYAGIRPKLEGPNDGFKDFSIQDKSVHGLTGLINLFGIDSPGLTSSLAIADAVHDMIINDE